MSLGQIFREQQLNADAEVIWQFISNPENLRHITPDYLGFEIKSPELPDNMYEGMVIKYDVRPLLGIRNTWVTEITHIKEGAYFVDEQRVGPYKWWHHQHIIRPNDEGTLMQDIVSYQLPLGPIGSLANVMFVRRQLKEIFDYRQKVLERLFNE